MKQSISALLLILTFLATGGTASANDFIAEGDALFNKRATLTNGEWAANKNAGKAIEAYMKAYSTGKRTPELYICILKGLYFQGTYAAIDENRQEKIFEQAIEIGEEGLSVYPEDAGINYWLSGAWGRWAEVSGIIQAARKGVADKIKALAEKVIEVDPDYEDAAGYRVLGRVHHKSPKIPFILWWPSDKEALRNLKKAVDAAPQNKTNLRFYAEILLDAGKKEEAISYLKEIIETPALEFKIVEDLKDQSEAQKLLDSIDDSGRTREVN